jgi:magnesium chelatase family protein
VLDSLRQPLETGTVSVARRNAIVTFPARVQLGRGDESVPLRPPWRSRRLACSPRPRCAADYQAKCRPAARPHRSHVDVQAVAAADLSCRRLGGSAGAERVKRRAIQTRRATRSGFAPMRGDGDLLTACDARRAAAAPRPGAEPCGSARGYHA